MHEKSRSLSEYINLNYDIEQQMKIRNVTAELNHKDISSFLDTKLDYMTVHFNEKGAYIPESTIIHFTLEGILSGELRPSGDLYAK